MKHATLFALACLASIGTLFAAEPPAPRKLSEVASAADLVAQAKQYVETFEKNLSGADQYRDAATKISRDANTLSAIALVLGHDDKENALKANAAAIIAASQELAEAEGYDAAKAAFAKLQTAISAAPGGEQTAPPKTEPVASMELSMKQVVLLNNRLKRGMRRFEKQSAELARDAAVLAAIGQAIVYDASYVEDDEQMDQWYQLCGQMRDNAGELNAKLRAADKAGAEAALLKLAQNCDDCHKAFQIEVK